MEKPGIEPATPGLQDIGLETFWFRYMLKTRSNFTVLSVEINCLPFSNRLEYLSDALDIDPNECTDKKSNIIRDKTKN